MNEYVIIGNSWAWLTMRGSVLAFMSETDSLETGGYINWSYKGPYYNGFSKPARFLVQAGANTEGEDIPTVVIGGNFTDKDGNITPNLGYSAYFIQSAITAVEFLGDGNFSFAAQTGAISTKSLADDANQLVWVSNRIDTERDNPVTSESYVSAAQDVSAYGMMASGRLTFLGSLSGNIGAMSYGNLLNGYSYQNDSDIVQVATDKSNTIRAVCASGSAVAIENNFTGNLFASAQAVITNVNDGDGAVTGNTIEAIGLAASGGMVISGRFAGKIKATVNPYDPGDSDSGIGSGSSGEEGSGSKITSSGTMLYCGSECIASGLVQNAYVTHNTIATYGLYASGIIFDGEISGGIYTEIFDVTLKAQGSAASVVSGNIIENIGICASGSIVMNSNYGGIIDLLTQSVYFIADTADRKDGITSQDNNYVYTYGIRAGSSLEAAANLFGTISVRANDVVSTGGHEYDEYNYLTVEAYGIYAPTINVRGGLSSHIYVEGSDVASVGSRYSVTVGIGATDMTVGYFGADITLLCPAGTRRSVGLWIEESFTNNDDGIVDFSGSIDLSGDNGYIIGMMGFSRGLNIRITGSISSPQYAIFAGTITYNYSWIRYGTNDSVELAAGSSVTGNIELQNGKNTITVDSNASFSGNVSTSLGTLNLQFNLNSNLLVGEVLSDNVIMALTNDETLLASTTSISVNLNDVEVGKGYVLCQIADYSSTNWDNREITFSYQGKSGKVTIGKTFTNDYMTISTAFTDGLLTFTVEALTPVIYTAPTIGVVEQDFEDNTITLNWQALANTEKYEVEYSINGGQSIVVWVDGDENQLDLALNTFSAGSTVKWRVRQHISTNYLVSNWSGASDFTIASPDNSLENFGNAQFDTSAGVGANTSVIQLDWNDGICAAGIAYYEVRYFQTDKIIDPDWNSMAQTDGNQTSISAYATKKVTNNSVIVSGLSNLEYVYWQVRVISNNGTVYDWTDGQTMRIYAGDTEGPEFDTASITAIVDFNASLPKDQMMTVTVTWDPAVDADGKSGVGGYDIAYRLEGTTAWTIINCTYDATSQVLHLANGIYEWKFSATDFAGNRSAEYYGVDWKGDDEPPVFTYGPNLQAEVTSGTNKTNDVLLTWNAAEEAATTLSAQAGMKSIYYIIS